MLNKEVRRLDHNESWWIYTGETKDGPAFKSQPCRPCGFERTTFYCWVSVLSPGLAPPSQWLEKSNLQFRTPDQTLRGLLMRQTVPQTSVPRGWVETQTERKSCVYSSVWNGMRRKREGPSRWEFLWAWARTFHWMLGEGQDVGVSQGRNVHCIWVLSCERQLCPQKPMTANPREPSSPLQTQIASKISGQLISSLEAGTPGPSSEEE